MVMVVMVSFIHNVCHCARSVRTTGKRCFKLWIAACFCYYACFVSWTKVTCSSRNYLGILIFNYKGKRYIYGTCWVRFRPIVVNRLFETSLPNTISFLSFYGIKGSSEIVRFNRFVFWSCLIDFWTFWRIPLYWRVKT